MVKSPFANTPKNSIKQPLQADRTSTLSLVVNLDLKIEGGVSYNLADWCHIRCDNNAPLAKPLRIKYMQKLKERVKCQQKDKYSDDTIFCQLKILRQYIKYCDSNKLEPFSKGGYLGYCGNTGELVRQVALAVEPKNYIFEYADGDGLGIKEATAHAQRCQINTLLTSFGLDVMQYNFLLKEFKQARETQSKPYQVAEWEVMLRRITFYFSSLVTQLIAYKDENPTSPPPLQMEVIVDEIDGKDVTFTVGSLQFEATPYSPCSPFHQCMLAGYYLFSYYTAFNTTSIFDVRHPIRSVRQEKEGRTSAFVKIKAYKGRSHKEVEALFARLDESDHPEVGDNVESGFIIAEINKREKKGIVDGLTFIKVISLFSKAYSDEQYGPLFYIFSADGRKKNLNLSLAPYFLSKNLGLYSSDRGNIISYLIETFNDLVNNDIYPEYKKIISDKTGFTCIKKEYLTVTAKIKKRRIIDLAHCIVTCLTDTYINGIVMPLQFSEPDSNETMIVSFNYKNGKKGSFRVNSKYKLFLEKLQDFSHVYNPIPERCRQPINVKNTPYLIPLGPKSGTYQWESIEGLINQTILSGYGVGLGDYYLNINTSRIRKTTSYFEYRDEDKGFGARQILQHTLKVQDRDYINGHPWENTKMISQSVQILAKVAFGMSRNDAIEGLQKELNIPVLAYEKYKKRNMPSNPNGTVCDGIPVIVSEKDYHYAARKFAEKEGVIEEGEKITCYQYDLCIYCKKAQIVDDPRSIYKLLSFIDAMQDAIDFYPDSAGFINKKVQLFQTMVSKVPLETIDKAEKMLLELGRYPIFKTIDGVMQHIPIR